MVRLHKKTINMAFEILVAKRDSLQTANYFPVSSAFRMLIILSLPYDALTEMQCHIKVITAGSKSFTSS